MIEVSIGMFETLALTVLVIYFGNFLRNKFPVLKKYCIPGAVVGGTLVSFVTCALYMGNIMSFTFESSTMNTFFYNIFFATGGAAASLKLLKKGGKLVLIFTILAATLAFCQNALALGVGMAMDVPPLVAVMAGSTPLTGGHGNAASFGPQAAALPGGEGAMEVALASATFGLIAGCIIGGPMGRRMIRKNDLHDVGADGPKISSDIDVGEEEKSSPVQALMSSERSTTACFYMLLACGFGQLTFKMLDGNMPAFLDWFSLPIHVMCMLGGILLRVYLDKTNKGDDALYQSIETIGEISLALFVTMSIMTMSLWQLIDLAGPLFVILSLQLVLIYLFCTQITFRACGKNYDAAIIATGHSGFGLGAVPVSMASMSAVCSQYSYSKLAYFVVPLIGGFISNITNAMLIAAFINFAAGL